DRGTSAAIGVNIREPQVPVRTSNDSKPGVAVPRKLGNYTGGRHFGDLLDVGLEKPQVAIRAGSNSRCPRIRSGNRVCRDHTLSCHLAHGVCGIGFREPKISIWAGRVPASRTRAQSKSAGKSSSGSDAANVTAVK